jgi:hypothetical protein
MLGKLLGSYILTQIHLDVICDVTKFTLLTFITNIFIIFCCICVTALFVLYFIVSIFCLLTLDIYFDNFYIFVLLINILIRTTRQKQKQQIV